jgi:hypothetical protein
MKRVISGLLAALLLCSTLAMAKDPASPHDADINHVLTAIDFGAEVKASLREAIPEEDLRKDKGLQAVLKLADERYVAAAVPLLKSAVSAEEAHQMAEFYRSPTMLSIFRQQKASGNPAAPANVTREQKAEFDDFMQGAGGAAVMRMMQAMASPDFLEKLVGALEKEI